MPQLDTLIVLPQIFWLIIIFIFFYFVLTYYFLPTFLKTIKSRKKLFNHNHSINLNLLKEILLKRKNVLKDLNLNLTTVKSIVFVKLLNLKFKFKQKPFKQKYSKLTNIIFKALNKSVYYCNLNLLNSLKFYPFMLNKIKK
nr:ATP synthase F1 subunit 8 [Neorhodomela munita]